MEQKCIVCGNEHEEAEMTKCGHCEGLVCSTCEHPEMDLKFCSEGCLTEYSKSVQERDWR